MLPTKPYISTFTGKVIVLDEVKPSDISIEDIAFGLGGLNRYMGLTRQPYNVAQHSVIVSRICAGDRNTQLAALLHDASEAYIQDIINPVKKFIRAENEAYDALESLWQSVIETRFGVQIGYDKEAVAAADRSAFYHEVKALALHPENYGIPMLPEWPVIPCFHPLDCWSRDTAARKFLARFEELQKSNKKSLDITGTITLEELPPMGGR